MTDKRAIDRHTEAQQEFAVIEWIGTTGRGRGRFGKESHQHLTQHLVLDNFRLTACDMKVSRGWVTQGGSLEASDICNDCLDIFRTPPYL